MSKRITTLLIALLLLIPMGISVMAASDSTSVVLEKAEIVEIDEEFFLEVSVKNNSSISLYGSYVMITAFDEEKLSFKETSFYSTYYLMGLINELSPSEVATVVFELDTCTDKHADLDLAVSFSYDGDTVFAGGASNENNFGTCTYENVLKAEESRSKLDVIISFLKDTGFVKIAENWKVLVMFLISFVLIYLAIVKKFEPLLLLPIAFGMLLTNLPGGEMYHSEFFAGGHVHWEQLAAGGGLLDYLYLGVKLGIYPCLIFLGIGAMTDFGPLIANPKSLLLGAAAQLGIFITYFGTTLMGFTEGQASSIGIIGGADGPTAIFVTSKLAPELLGPIAVAAYSYMALVPFIQPPIMKALTTKKERMIVMKELRPVSKREKMLFPIAVTFFVSLLVPSATPLIGCLMLGNLMKESGVVDRITKAAQNELMNIVTIFLGISVGATATAEAFIDLNTLKILAMGIVAFGFGTAGGVLLAKFMNLFLKNKINPLIGSAGVSAVPMAARVSQMVGQKENPSNFLLMHAMGPNVAGVIGSAIAAGVLIALFG